MADTENTQVIRIPAHYKPRPEQIDFWKAYHSGIRFFDLCWHRREGKDLTALNATVEEILTKRPGLAWHMFPTLAQGRKVLWDATDNEGRPITSAFPKPLITEINKADMRIKCKFVPDIAAGKTEVRESTWQVVGADNPDSLRGGNPILVVISEFGDIAPNVWYEIIQPILLANNGKAMFVWTPKGRNHAYTLHQAAMKSMYNPDEPKEFKWFAQVLTADDTTKWVDEQGVEVGIPTPAEIKTGKYRRVPVITKEAIEESRKQGMDEAKILQEYFCSFDAALKGAYFGEQMNDAAREGRISSDVKHRPDMPVITAWDLGMDDTMEVIFAQCIEDSINIIDYYSNNGKTLDHYIKEVLQKPYTYSFHFGPHDLNVRELGAGSRLEHARKLGIAFRVIPRVSHKEDSINAARAILPRCRFNIDRCAKLIEALKSYTKKWDEKRQCYSDTPLHNWCSNACLSGFSPISMTGGSLPIKDVRVGDKVRLGDREAAVIRAGMTGIRPVVRVYTSVGILECTPDHKIFTGRGLVEAAHLRYSDVIATEENKLWLNLLGDTTGLRDAVISSTTETGGGTGGNENYMPHRQEGSLDFCIDTCSELKTVWRQFLKTAIGVTLTKIIGKLEAKTPDDTQLNEQTMSSTTENGSTCMEEGTTIQNSTASCTDMYGKKHTGLFRRATLSIIRTVIKATIMKVISVCYRIPCIRDYMPTFVENTERMEPVYNITVEGHHCYYASGMLVSNCDAFQCLAMGLFNHPTAMKRIKLTRTEDMEYRLFRPDMSKADDYYDIFNYRGG